jgi:hypothetical protein
MYMLALAATTTSTSSKAGGVLASATLSAAAKGALAFAGMAGLGWAIGACWPALVYVAVVRLMPLGVLVWMARRKGQPTVARYCLDFDLAITNERFGHLSSAIGLLLGCAVGVIMFAGFALDVFR